MNKVLLIYPVSDPKSVDIPYDLLQIATILKSRNFAPVIIDSAVQPDYRARIESEIDGAVCVVVSVLTNHIARALRISRDIKALRSDATIIWIGLHPTMFPEQTVSDPSVDIVCVGDPEFTVSEITEALKNKSSINDIKGIVYKDEEKNVIATGRGGLFEMDELPPIDYSLVDYSLYRDRYVEDSPSHGGVYRVHIFYSGRGCPHRCPYCINSNPELYYRSHSLARLIEEFESIVKQFDPDVIYIRDGSFFADPERTVGFFYAYRERKWRFRWIAMSCVNYFNDDHISDAALHAVAPSIFRIGVGVESGASDLRYAMNKRITDEQVVRVARLLNRDKVFAVYYFMIGVPGETPDDMVQTARFILRLHRIAPKSIFSLKIFHPHMAYEWRNRIEELNYRYPQSLDEWAEKATRADGKELFLSDLDWVPDKRLVQYLRTAVIIATMPRQRVFQGEGTLAFKWMKYMYYAMWKLSLRTRLALNFWSLFAELRLHTFQNRYTE